MHLGNMTDISNVEVIKHYKIKEVILAEVPIFMVGSGVLNCKNVIDLLNQEMHSSNLKSSFSVQVYIEIKILDGLRLGAVFIKKIPKMY